MQVVPFVTETRDVRVIESNIGRVMPIVDIAKAIDYPRNKIVELLERNSELFEGTVGTVTVTTVQDNRGTEQVRDYEVKALNSYGVFGLLMKLDYNRVQSEEKKQNVIRFQKWAMQVLGDVASGKKATVRKPNKSKLGVYNRIVGSLTEISESVPRYNKKEAIKELGISSRTMDRYIDKGYIPAYKRLNSYGHWEYAFRKSEIDSISERLSSGMYNIHQALREHGTCESIYINNHIPYNNLKKCKEQS